ncbi:LysR family transcriptional regulator [Sesbania bispinosa]|nr:LysR family transcriptional regulator [Sesbania bispinosa]
MEATVRMMATVEGNSKVVALCRVAMVAGWWHVVDSDEGDDVAWYRATIVVGQWRVE